MTDVRETKRRDATRRDDRPAQALSPGERAEMEGLGIPDLETEATEAARALRAAEPSVARRAVSAPDVLNEATDYWPVPSSFARGLRVDIGAGRVLLVLSGTASVDEHGATVHPGDFRAQTWRTYRNLTRLLDAEGATWHDVVRTTCYLRDIERDYEAFNQIRTRFYAAMGLSPVPASTGIQARLCRSDLLIEIEALAIVRAGKECRCERSGS